MIDHEEGWMLTCEGKKADFKAEFAVLINPTASEGGRAELACGQTAVSTEDFLVSHYLSTVLQRAAATLIIVRPELGTD